MSDPDLEVPQDEGDFRITFMRLKLAEIRTKKDRLLHTLSRLDVEEERLAVIFDRNFPGHTFRPATPWVALSYAEKCVVHYLWKRGGAKRIRDVAAAYLLASGEPISPDAFAMRASRLHDKGVLTRAAGGWAVAEDYVEHARVIPEPPAPPVGPEAMRRAALLEKEKGRRMRPTFRNLRQETL